MQTAKFTPGMIYLVKNQFEEEVGLQITQHNYIVLGSIMNGRNSGFQMVQAMEITSNPRNEEIDGKAVPIILSNGGISWILPYNIHSITFTDISKGKFHGILRDSDHFTVNRFIQMLVDLYNDELNLGFVDHDVIMNEYRDYCSWFFETHKGFKQYRDYREMSFHEKDIEIAPALSGGTTLIYKQCTKDSLKPKEYYEQDELRCVETTSELDPESEETELEYETVYSSEKVELMNPIPISKIKNQLNHSNNGIRYKNSGLMSFNEKKLIMSFQDFPLHTKDWMDNQILLFIKAYQEYGPKNLSALSNRWNNFKSVTYVYKVAKEEAEKREIALIQ